MHYGFVKYPISKKFNKLDAAMLDNDTDIWEICNEV